MRLPMRGMAFPIRVRLTLWYAALLAAILLTAGLFLADRLRDDLVGRVNTNLGLAASEITVDYRTGGESEFRDVTDSSMAGLARGQSAAQLLSAAGTVMDSAGGAVPKAPMIPSSVFRQALGGLSIYTTARLGASGIPFRLIAVRFPGPDPPWVLVLGTSLGEVNRSISQLRVLLLLIGPIGLVAAAWGGWWLAGKGLRPVAAMTTRARQIHGEGPKERLDLPKADDELRRLAVTLNEMLERIQATADRERRFIGDAAHELRTPLAIMNSELEVSLRSGGVAPGAAEVLRSAKEEVDRMSRLVEDLLVLARLDEGKLDLLLEPVELMDVAATAVHRIARVADSRGVLCDLQGEGGETRADRTRIEQVMMNLLVNAVKHSPTGSTVTVTGWRAGSEVGLSVADAGPGIPKEALPHLFERFYRADGSRSVNAGGSGLGLAICKEIAEAHSGRVWAEAEQGRGSRFYLALPAVSREVERSP